MALAGISTENLKKYTTKEDLRLVGKWGLVNVGKLSRGLFHINLVSLLWKKVLMNLIGNFFRDSNFNIYIFKVILKFAGLFKTAWTTEIWFA